MVEVPTLVGLPARYECHVLRATAGIGATVSAMPNNPARWGFICVAGVANGFFNIDKPATGGAGFGFPVPTAAPFLTMTARDYPGLVQREWFWGPVPGGGTITVIEICLLR